MDTEPTPQDPKPFVLRPEALMLSVVGLGTMFLVLCVFRIRQLERENQVLQQNYRGVVGVLNTSRSGPCADCAEKKAQNETPVVPDPIPTVEEVSQNGTTGLHQATTSGGFPTPE